MLCVQTKVLYGSAGDDMVRFQGSNKVPENIKNGGNRLPLSKWVLTLKVFAQEKIRRNSSFQAQKHVFGPYDSQS